MPWNDVKPMDQKLLFIADYLRDIASLAELCYRYGISRKTGYKWIRRYEQLGMEGLDERSRKPITSPSQVPYQLRQAIIQLRQSKHGMLGAKKIHVLLKQQYPHEITPSKTTIYNILKQENLALLYQRQASRFRGHAATARAKEKVGLATPMDTYRAEIRLKGAEDELARVQEVLADLKDLCSLTSCG